MQNKTEPIAIAINGKKHIFTSEESKLLKEASDDEILALLTAYFITKKERPSNTLNELAQRAHSTAVAKGWWDGNGNDFGTIIALCHSELSEALEEFREGNPEVYFVRNGVKISDLSQWNGEKLEGEITELADCIIRILDFCGHRRVDIQKVIDLKMRYNESRSYRHGGKKC